MNQEQFDNSIRQKLDELNFETNDMQWAKLQQALDAKRNENASDKPIGWWASLSNMRKLAAVLLPLLIINLSYLFITRNNASDIVVKNNTATQTQDTAKITNQVANNTTITNAENSTYTVAAGNTTNNNIITKVITNNTQSYNTKSTLVKKINTPTYTPTEYPVEKITKTNAKDVAQQLPQNINYKVVQPEVKEQKLIIANNDKALVIAENGVTIAQQANKLIPAQRVTMRKPVHLSIVSNAGLGNNNKGSYNLGVSAEKNINQKLYFETAVSFANNSLQDLTSTSEVVSAASVDNTGNSLVGTTNLNARASSYKNDAEVVQAIANTTPRYHIEFAPSVGYKITKRIKISAGVDVAKAIYTSSSANDLDYLKSKSSADVEVRNWDAGANARIEVQLNKRITLGYRRRNGLTDITPNQTIASKRDYNNIILKVLLK
jgi:hypothetical protein